MSKNRAISKSPLERRKTRSVLDDKSETAAKSEKPTIDRETIEVAVVLNSQAYPSKKHTPANKSQKASVSPKKVSELSRSPQVGKK